MTGTHTPTAPQTTPSTLRRLAAVVCAGVCVLMLAACNTVDQDEALASVNADRNAAGIASLANDLTINSRAQAWAERMASECKIYHQTTTSGALSAEGVPAGWRSLGENVGYGPSVKAIEAGFMGSTGHRANILNGKFNTVGVGVAHGTCSGRDTVFVTQVFAQY